MSTTVDVRTRGARRLRVVLAVALCGLSVAIAVQNLIYWSTPAAGIPPFTDAVTYRAAGERLNQGRPLYGPLQADDRPVVNIPAYGTDAPLLSPPPIAVLWRPLAAMGDLGFVLWVAAVWAALLGTCFYLVVRIGLPAALLVAVLAVPIGLQLASANVAGFFPLVLVAAWTRRRTPSAHVPIGLIAAIKIAPVSMTGWELGTLRRMLIPAIGGAAALLVLSVLGAGWSSWVDYLSVATEIAPSDLSLSAQTGVTWMSPLVLVGGTLAAVALGRWPRVSFSMAVVACVLGTPALYLSGLVTLMALAAPIQRPGEAIEDGLGR